jgi:8-oxo-dGTP diphosphatase
VSRTPKHSVAVVAAVLAAVFREDGRVLAIRRQDSGEWQPPGGVLELAETFEEGVRREVLEETGVVVHVQRVTASTRTCRTGSSPWCPGAARSRAPPQASEEAAAVQWLTLDEVTEYMEPAHAVRIIDALGDAPTSRAHDGTNVLTA